MPALPQKIDHVCEAFLTFLMNYCLGCFQPSQCTLQVSVSMTNALGVNLQSFTPSRDIVNVIFPQAGMQVSAQHRRWLSECLPPRNILTWTPLYSRHVIQVCSINSAGFGFHSTFLDVLGRKRTNGCGVCFLLIQDRKCIFGVHHDHHVRCQVNGLHCLALLSASSMFKSFPTARFAWTISVGAQQVSGKSRV